MKVYITLCHDDFNKCDYLDVFITKEKAIEHCKSQSRYLCDKYWDKSYEEQEETDDKFEWSWFHKDESEGLVNFKDKDGFEHYAYVIEKEIKE